VSPNLANSPGAPSHQDAAAEAKAARRESNRSMRADASAKKGSWLFETAD